MEPRAKCLVTLLALSGAWAGPAWAQGQRTPSAVESRAVLLEPAQGDSLRLTYSFHVGSAHPLGTLDTLSDANIHVDVDLAYRLKLAPYHLDLKLTVGLNQFTAESFTGIEHPRWINASANVQIVSAPTATGLRGYVQAGPGVYWPKSGSSEAGFNVGLGAQVPLGGVFSLEFGLDFHQIQTDDPTRFVTTQLGVLFR